MHALLEGERRLAEAIARKQEGRGVSGPRRSRPRRNATAARINRSRDPGEFIRFVAASLKAARVSFASRSLLAVHREGDVQGGPRVCVRIYTRWNVEASSYRHRGGKERERERERRQSGRSRANRDMWPRIYVPPKKSPRLDYSSLPLLLLCRGLPSFPLLSSTRCSLLRLFSCCFRDGGTVSKRESR